MRGLSCPFGVREWIEEERRTAQGAEKRSKKGLREKGSCAERQRASGGASDGDGECADSSSSEDG